MTNPLLAAVAALPMLTAPAFVITPPLSTMTQLLLAKAPLPIWSTPPAVRFKVALAPPPLTPAIVTVLLELPYWPFEYWPTYRPVTRAYPPLVTSRLLLVPPGVPPPPALADHPTSTYDAVSNVPLLTTI
ncbi:MAG: hypothetical protein PCFJNLEI_04156 [Verrucomicrobiae bacterium]|nr:hypothetical protein [Verrucomicrobiae bacterium]